jgi:hypothetical protein
VSQCTVPLSTHVNLPWPLFFKRGVVYRTREELGAAYKKCPPLKKGDEGGFEVLVSTWGGGNRSCMLVEPMNSITTLSLDREEIRSWTSFNRVRTQRRANSPTFLT